MADASVSTPTRIPLGSLDDGQAETLTSFLPVGQQLAELAVDSGATAVLSQGGSVGR